MFDDEFGDNDPGANVGGVGAGVHAEGALIYEADTVLHYGNYDGDYASSGAITLDAFTGATTYASSSRRNRAVSAVNRS
ncbi:hypothetical protein BH11MYX3_BH11MYX3_34420 [soil metagenome]